MERTRKFNSKMIRKRIILGKKLTRGIVLKEYGKSISTSKAYEIIRILNLELEEKNILTIRGAVSEKYFNARKKIIVQLLKGVKKNE